MKNVTKFLWLIAFSLMLFSGMNVKAQTVLLPSNAFTSYLKTNYPSCFNGNLMDTTCSDIINETSLDIFEIYMIDDLTGIEYFDNLDTLDLQNHPIDTIPYLPMDLLYLDISHSLVFGLSNLPATLKTLNREAVTGTPIETILPPTLEEYNINDCYADSFPPFPSTLKSLSVRNCELASLHPLPSGLEYLDISGMMLPVLPQLPNTLKFLDVRYNSFDTLNVSLSNLETLYLGGDSITTVLNLPNTLTTLYVGGPGLDMIDFLPSSIEILSISNTNLSILPNIPSSATSIEIWHNSQLTSLSGSFPQSLTHLELGDNSLVCLPLLPASITTMTLTDSNLTCLPNIIPALDPVYQNYPLCIPNDPQNNPLGCSMAQGVDGYIYADQNTNCIKEVSDSNLGNVPLNVYDNLGNLVSSVASYTTGRYNFHLSNGQYDVVVDTVNKPYTFDCQYPGVDSTIILNSGNPLADNVDFALICKPGFDIGTKNIYTSGWVFPGQNHTLTVKAGDMSNYYNLNCSNGVSGTVTVTVTGPVTYQNAAIGSLTPSVAGNVYTYSVADFGSVNMNSDFGLIFSTDTTAVFGYQICVSTVVTPNSGDNNLANNTFSTCYPVVNSYDPNNKLAFPTSIAPGYDDYITYTINFQNTGSAPAFNIRLEDTLSSYLDLSTFEVVDYSHDMHYNLTNNKLTVYYPNIMLVDSTTSEPDSKGYITYRVKANGNVIDGDQIENTAYIFFDFNPAIVTNTIVTEVGLYQSGLEELKQIDLTIYPNPSSNEFNIRINENILDVQVYNQQGQLVKFNYDADINQLDLVDNDQGIYFLHVVLEDQTITKKLIKK